MDPRPTRWARARHPQRLLLVLGLTGLLVAACGSAASPYLSNVGAPVRKSAGGEATAAPSAAAATAGPYMPGDDYSNGTDEQVLSEMTRGRLIVRTGQISIRVKDLDAAVGDAARAIEALGGYVSASQRQGEDQTASATVTYRIPVDRWDDALAAVRKLGEKVLGEQTGSQEVTDQVVDLGARLVNLRATETALQKIMDRATKIPDILEVQTQLATVRDQIERLTAEKQQLEQSAALATLNVDFTLPSPVAVTQVQQGWDPAREADQAAATLVDMGQSAVNAGIWLVIVWLPILLIVGIVALIAYVITRRVRRRPPVPPAPPTTDLPIQAAAG